MVLEQPPLHGVRLDMRRLTGPQQRAAAAAANCACAAACSLAVLVADLGQDRVRLLGRQLLQREGGGAAVAGAVGIAWMQRRIVDNTTLLKSINNAINHRQLMPAVITTPTLSVIPK